jgi:preprotein translocase subunit SecE
VLIVVVIISLILFVFDFFIQLGVEWLLST